MTIHGVSPYVLDSAAIIDLHQHFPTRRVRVMLRDLAQQGELRIPEGVVREIKRKSDRAKQTVEQLADSFPACVVQMARVHNLQTELTRIELAYGQEIRVGSRRYSGFWASASGRKAVEGQVLATAKKLVGTVVSDDKAVERASLLENVPCIGWTEFARLASSGSQGTLFQGSAVIDAPRVELQE